MRRITPSMSSSFLRDRLGGILSSRLTSHMYIISAEAVDNPRELHMDSNFSFTSESILMDNVVCAMAAK